MKYRQIILKDLMDIYERRDANSSSFKSKIKIKLSKEKYPKYFEARTEFDEAISNLVQSNLIFVKKIPHDTVIDYIYLNIEKVEEIKSLLEIDSISSKRAELLNELDNYDDAILVRFRENIIRRIESHLSIKKFLDSDIIDVIRAVHYLENLNHVVYERNASNFIFNDSKRLTKLREKIDAFYGESNILEKKGILSVKPYLYLKGTGIVIVNNQKIDLKLLNSSIGLPIDKLEDIIFDNVDKVITIENQTTFYDYEDNGLIIYLGGYPTKLQIRALKKITEVCNHFYHFGDIDYGGFMILNNLMEQLGMKVETINMSLETLSANIEFVQKYDDESYEERLKTLLTKPLLKPYYNVIETLIDKKIKLEQESFYNR